MNRAAVLIGVNRVKGLPALADAVGGARRMRDWGLAQGMAPEHVKLITDADDAPVMVSAIEDAVAELLDPMAGIEQLLVYFAGHGLNVGGNEIWLLTRGLERSSESVDSGKSAELARQAGIPHVIFVSDACRTAAVGVQQQQITGSSIFPMASGGGTESDVDQFFACALGNPALEIQDATSAGTFTALYTDVLLGLLQGAEPSIVESAGDGLVPDGVVRPWPLKRILPAKVHGRLITLKLQARPQTPQARICSDPQRAWLARLAPPPVVSPQPSPLLQINRMAGGPAGAMAGALAGAMAGKLARSFIRRAPTLADWVGTSLDMSLLSADGDALVPAADVDADVGGIVRQVQELGADFGPLGFETGCGIKLRGARALRAFGSDASLDWVEAGQILRAHPRSSRPDRVLLEMEDGSGVVVPLLPGFIAELSFGNGVLEDLAFEPALAGDPDASALQERAQRRHQRALIAAAADRGIFQPDRTTLTGLVERLLSEPVPDPVLLVHLAYGLHDAGMAAALRDLIDQVLARDVTPLFDAALLVARGDADPRLLFSNAPGMPLLARGWPILSARLGDDLPGDLVTVARMRLPGLWTCFQPQATPLLQKLMFPPEVPHA